MEKLRDGQYEYKMEIPVKVLYSKQDDGSVSIVSVSVPTEEELYSMVDGNAKSIKAGAELRI